MRRIALSLALLLSCATTFADGEFTVNGLGGGGGTFTPTVSPWDSNLLFLSCDMTGVYRSADRGKTWTMLHYKYIYGALGCRPAFTWDSMYWVCGDYGSGLRVSRDKGLTWSKVIEGEAPWKSGPITHLAAMNGPKGNRVLVGTGTGAWISLDGCKTWTKIGDGKCSGLLAMHFGFYAALQSPDGKTSRLLTSEAGTEWTEVPVEAAKGNPITSLAGASRMTSTHPPTLSDSCLFATVQNVGILCSRYGEPWEVAMDWQQQSDVLASRCDVVYACQVGNEGGKIWRTVDTGKTWTSIFHMSGPEANVELAWVQPYLHWSYFVCPLGLGIDPNNPDVVMASMVGDFYRSENGGKSWYPIMNKPMGVLPGDPCERFKSTGMEVTTTYDVVFDPNDTNRRYLCYTDIGFGRSVDKGETWIPSTKGSPWQNTFYQIAFDPFVKGRIYAACSNRHDIPGWSMGPNRGPNAVGGVCVSENYGASWQVLSDSLPKLPCTSIVGDPKSAADKLTMYVTLYEGGVYKTTDGGKTWACKSKGLGNPPNLHSCRVKIHPKSGNLYCLVTGLREGYNFPAPGGVWKSTDGGESWADVTASLKLSWPCDFAVSAADENVIYVAAGTVPRGPQGGIYRTTDGGKSWKKLLGDADVAKWCTPPFVHGMVVKLHPDDPKRVYFGTATHGLWYSADAGDTWVPFKKFPFKAILNVVFDPADHDAMYVTTYGAGCWKGKSTPVNEGSPF